jgi:hypothetical protein
VVEIIEESLTLLEALRAGDLDVRHLAAERAPPALAVLERQGGAGRRSDEQDGSEGESGERCPHEHPPCR